MSEFIEREAFKAEVRRLSTHYLNEWDTLGVLAAADRIPAADVVSRGAYDQTNWERCVALTQLKEIGKGLGERMDDVRPVRRGKWTLNKDGSGTCSECGFVQNSCWDLDNWDNFCHHCGADMREES